ncbi:MAG: SH3 domain-containing protein [Lachnospiraceae bacterium]|nr:SH3 domain-containing protein [Lachnospiraceae bacterium]
MVNFIKIHKIWAFVLVLAILLTSLNVSSFAYTSQLGSIKASNVNVRSGPGTNYSRKGMLSVGTQVVVIDEQSGSDGRVWCKITYNNGANEGFVLKDYIGMSSSPSGITTSAFDQMLSQQGFPESYKPYLRKLHEQYPNWTFKAVKTGIDWETAVQNEAVTGRNLVYKDSKSSWKSTADGAYDWNSCSWPGFDGDAWKAASEDIIRYYMDPRNFLDSEYIFQFLDQKYVPEVQTYKGVETMVKGTFMESVYTGALDNGAAGSAGSTQAVEASGVSGSSSEPVTVGGVQLISPGQALSLGSSPDTSSGGSAGSASNEPGGSISGGPAFANASTSAANTSGTYVDMIMKAAGDSGVNPYVLVSMIIQEQGKNGNTSMVSGSSGAYNFFNVEAYAQNGMSATERGLWWAGQSGSYDRPWNTAEKAIVGGAKFYGEGYVMKSQNTFYLKKFNVSSTNTYKHQYMTNVQAAASEGYNLSKAYTSEIRNAAHDFEIPVFNNMPETPAPLPEGDGSPNNKLSGLGVEGFAITPTFSSDTLSYDLIVDTSVISVNVSASAYDSNAQISGLGTYNLQSGANKISVTVTAQNKTTRTYVLNVIRQNNGPTYKSGVGGTGSTGGPGSTVYSPGAESNVVIINSTNTSSGTGNNSGSGSGVILVGPGQ